MSLEDNKRVVRDFLGHYAAGRYDAALDMLAADSTWWLPGHPQEFPAAGSVDKETVRRRLAANLKLLPHGLEIDVGAITAEDDRVAVEAESRATLVDGSRYHNRYHFLFVVRGREIVLVKEYLDTLHSSRVLGAARAAFQAGR
ncbi:MAG: nuclear transport factor 2 family protein [Steroidobacteraceae bacterium]|nr:nuclear transport factor 2 family protein [Steroidobacteraceae bacterium]MCW5572268.1 nuclear transport factor 2 family protein [Steroidobacteraceae bacterium]